jgi:hypothetical protein
LKFWFCEIGRINWFCRLQSLTSGDFIGLLLLEQGDHVLLPRSIIYSSLELRIHDLIVKLRHFDDKRSFDRRIGVLSAIDFIWLAQTVLQAQFSAELGS